MLRFKVDENLPVEAAGLLAGAAFRRRYRIGFPIWTTFHAS